AVEVLTNDRIEEVGEDLAMELGRVLETKIRVSSIKARLENLQ
ncbi:MAG: restriction endonuclease subunit S, partial [Oscillatoriales cyanobacterium]